MRIKIVTDSTSDLSSEKAAEYGIEVVPLKVIFGNQSFADGVDIDIDSFYDKLEHSGLFPSTSQPSPHEFAEVYSRFLKDPDVRIISIHVSGKLSGTLQAAEIAKTLLSDEEAARITVVDSKYACYGLAVFAIEMAKAAANGCSVEQCLQRFTQIRESIALYFVVDTLEYLQRGGRIGKASALIGSLLNIKPILTIDYEGIVSPVERVRGQKQAIKKIIDVLADHFKQEAVSVTVLHSRAEALAEQISVEINNRFQVTDLHFASIGAVIGTHVGPGAIAVLMYPQIHQQRIN